MSPEPPANFNIERDIPRRLIPPKLVICEESETDGST